MYRYAIQYTYIKKMYLLIFKLSMSMLIAYFGIVKLLPSNSGFGFIFILALALIGPNTKK